MFIAQSKSGAKWWNVLILVSIIVVVMLLVLAFAVKFKKDPKDPESLKATLALGKKK
jgi:heme/copper-type cytochrome/quinol oxidase subunit 2